MTTVYAQLRVSCGLSATINALQPEILKISTTETFAHWLDVQWLRLSNNNDMSDPIVQLGERREFQWAIVLDYILVRKIRSSFLLCQGIPPGQLVLEVEDEHLNWNVLKPQFQRILSRLNAQEEDWPLWHYNGEFKDIEGNMDNLPFWLKAKKLVQSVKGYYEIFESNIVSGPEGEWKGIFMNMIDFPKTLTTQHIAYHIDFYKTDFELSGLLETLGFELDSKYGRGYPQTVAEHSVVLINRPEHWVCEDSRARGTVLDSLTQGTDSIYPGDSFNYYKPLNNFQVLRKHLPKLAKIFPQIEVDIEDEDLTEFPDLELPETDNPQATAQKYHHSANAAYSNKKFRDALIDKRIEVALLEKAGKNLNYYQNLLEFTEWCMEFDKLFTTQENFQKLISLDAEIEGLNPNLRANRNMLEARFHMSQGNTANATNSFKTALKFYQDSNNYEKAFEIANSLGVSFSRGQQYKEAIESFKDALLLADQAKTSTPSPEVNTPQKYWPALVIALQKKIKYLQENMPAEAPKPDPNAITKVE